MNNTKCCGGHRTLWRVLWQYLVILYLGVLDEVAILYLDTALEKPYTCDQGGSLIDCDVINRRGSRTQFS